MINLIFATSHVLVIADVKAFVFTFYENNQVSPTSNNDQTLIATQISEDVVYNSWISEFAIHTYLHYKTQTHSYTIISFAEIQGNQQVSDAHDDQWSLIRVSGFIFKMNLEGTVDNMKFP